MVLVTLLFERARRRHEVLRAPRIAFTHQNTAIREPGRVVLENVLAGLHARAQPIVARLHCRHLMLYRDLLTQQAQLFLLKTNLLLKLIFLDSQLFS